MYLLDLVDIDIFIKTRFSIDRYDFDDFSSFKIMIDTKYFTNNNQS